MDLTFSFIGFSQWVFCSNFPPEFFLFYCSSFEISTLLKRGFSQQEYSISSEVFSVSNVSCNIFLVNQEKKFLCCRKYVNFPSLLKFQDPFWGKSIPIFLNSNFQEYKSNHKSRAGSTWQPIQENYNIPHG